MNRVLIAGAGAEVDLGFRSGIRFTQDTFYRQKVRLYNALGDFYERRLDLSCGQLIPSSYEPAFLFNSNGAAFKRLIANLAKDDSSFLTETLEKSLEYVEDDSSYSSEDYKKLFKKLIVETDDSDAISKQEAVLNSIPPDTHFGVLEQYYSEMLNPEGHKRRFWKLVNFYWSAFFSIVLPITDDLYNHLSSYKENRYAYILLNLDRVVHEVFDVDGAMRKTEKDCYYAALRGKFSNVITTNYTPYAASVVDCDNSFVAWLGGRLSQFEHLPELEFTDYSLGENHLKDDEFVFPYLLCQSPVKPVISLAQIDEYAKAAAALRTADEIVVLGYSFCNEDAHISSMVGEALRSESAKALVYFSHATEGEASTGIVELATKLRISESLAHDKIQIVPLESSSSKEFRNRCDAWDFVN